ncbi:MAG: thioredoxin family protein [Thermoanaerobaculia bacterium]|nr:thioredoxin family protein [Thermoanaerobaculia bacterium]
MKRLSTLLIFLTFLTPLLAAGELRPGDGAHGFELTDARTGKTVAFEPGDGGPAVIVFTCNHCPYAKAFEQRLVDLGLDYQEEGFAFYAINPNDDEKYPVERMGEMKSRAEKKDYPFPYLKDGDSTVARAYGARVTPHVFVVDGEGIVRYVGYIDDSARPDERSHEGLSDALNAMMAGTGIERASTKAFGCTIKWKE